MYIMTRLKLVLFSLLLGMAAVSLAGARLFPGLQSMGDGVIDYVDLNTGELVVSDMSHELDDRTSVRRSNGVFVSVESLRAGMKVRLYFDPIALDAEGIPTNVKGIELR